MKKLMTNNEIYSIANSLIEAFNDSDIKIPVKANFFLQKNKNNIITIAQELEKARMELVQKAGAVPGEDGGMSIPPEKVTELSNDLTELFSIEQEVDVNMIDLEWFGNAEFTSKQMDAITFMIKDIEE